MEDHHTVIVVYASDEAASSAVQKLITIRFPRTKLSVIGKGFRSGEKITGRWHADHGKLWGKLSSFWRNLWGQLGEGLYMALPQTGPLVMIGYFGALMLELLENTIVVGEMNALEHSFALLGIHNENIAEYKKLLKEDFFLVIATGNQEEVEHAYTMLKATANKQIRKHPRSFSLLQYRLYHPPVNLA